MTQFVAPFGILKNVVTARKIQTRSTHKLTLKSARRNNSWNQVKEKFEYFIFLYGKYMEKWICDILQVWIVEQTEIFSSTEFWICNVGAQLKVKATVSRDVLRKMLLTEKCSHLFLQKSSWLCHSKKWTLFESEPRVPYFCSSCFFWRKKNKYWFTKNKPKKQEIPKKLFLLKIKNCKEAVFVKNQTLFQGQLWSYSFESTIYS